MPHIQNRFGSMGHKCSHILGQRFLNDAKKHRICKWNWSRSCEWQTSDDSDNIFTHTGQDILLKPHSSYVLTSSSIFFVYPSKLLEIQLLHYNTVQCLNGTVGSNAGALAKLQFEEDICKF